MSAMSENDLSKLLEDVRNYLDITWDDPVYNGIREADDPKGDEKLLGMIKRGMASLAGKIGECDFLGNTQERTLLFQLVMYEYSGELQQFWENYKSEIVGLQIAKKVEEYAKSQA